MKRIQVLIAGVALAFGLVASATVPVAAAGAAGAARDDVCAGITAGGGTCNDDGDDVNNIVALIINIISAIAGVAAVIMIIIGGLRYITSGGDSSKIASAKSAITYAIIGLVIVALAQLIVRFVIKEAVA